jgi:TetR/AcrR family transcriptional regulator
METTELQIKKAAKKIFFGKGHFDAKMHEIATEARINRALLHYYFRNRKNLFEVVLGEALEESFIRMFSILSTNAPFEKKVEEAIHQIVDCLAEYPFIENFIISEMNRNPASGLTRRTIRDGRVFTKHFLREIKQYLSKNKLPAIEPEHFIVNMMSLCAYPSSTKPIVQNILGFGENDYRKFLLSRKKMITRLVLMKNIRSA